MRVDWTDTHRSRIKVIAGILFLGLAVSGRPATAQQSASVLVRVNVIEVPVVSSTLDSLWLAARASVPRVAIARTDRRVAEHGVRVRWTPAAPARPAPEPQPRPTASAPPERSVVSVEYVAN